MTALNTQNRTTVDAALPAVDLLFNRDSLGDLLGRPVSAGHLRHKPGVSVVAHLRDDDGGALRWLAAYHPAAEDKLDKVFERAALRGLELERVPVPGHPGHTVVTGPLELDPKLYRTLRPFRKSRHAHFLASPSVHMLNYNPFRRVVFAIESGAQTVVCKASTAHPHASAALLERMAAHGVPVLCEIEPDVQQLLGLPESPLLQYFPWFGQGDLSTFAGTHNDDDGRRDDPTPGDAGVACYAAGVALARLHSLPAGSGPGTLRAPGGRLSHLIDANAMLAPELAVRLRRIYPALEAKLRRAGSAAVIHGDFSADQVLVDGRDVRLTDLERCSYGAAASDLGSFAAVEILSALPFNFTTDVLALPRTSAMLDGYSAGPNCVDRSEVLGWTAFHLLARLSEPFRRCPPDWRREMADRLDIMEEIL